MSCSKVVEEKEKEAMEFFDSSDSEEEMPQETEVTSNDNIYEMENLIPDEDIVNRLMPDPTEVQSVNMQTSAIIDAEKLVLS